MYYLATHPSLEMVENFLHPSWDHKCTQKDEEQRPIAFEDILALSAHINRAHWTDAS